MSECHHVSPQRSPQQQFFDSINDAKMHGKGGYVAICITGTGTTSSISIDEFIRILDINESSKHDTPLTLEKLFEWASKYDLDITIQGDETFNVLHGESDSQAAMTVDELVEFIHYLKLHQKYKNKLK